MNDSPEFLINNGKVEEEGPSNNSLFIRSYPHTDSTEVSDKNRSVIDSQPEKKKTKKTNRIVSRKPKLQQKQQQQKQQQNIITAPVSDTSFAGWTVKPTNDAPIVTWTNLDSGFQYTVQNPDNCGQCLTKIQVYENGMLTHVSGVYLNRKTEAYNTLQNLLATLENLWVNRQTGSPKIDNLTCTKTPIAAWRRRPYSVSTKNITPDCATPKTARRKRKSEVF